MQKYIKVKNPILGAIRGNLVFRIKNITRNPISTKIFPAVHALAL
jgi:hypothetical protein